MIQLKAYLVSVVPGVRVAQLAIDGRGIARIPLSAEQERELAGCRGKTFTVTIEEQAPGPAEVGI